MWTGLSPEVDLAVAERGVGESPIGQRGLARFTGSAPVVVGRRHTEPAAPQLVSWAAVNLRETDTGVPVWERAWAATGALTVGLFAAGLVFADVLGSDNYPALDAPRDEVRRYFVDNTAEVRALSYFHTLAALALLGFAAYLQTVLRRDGAERSGLPALAAAGGVAAAVFLLLSAVFYRVLSEPVVAEDAALAHAMLLGSYLAGGPAISVPLTLLIGATVPSALRGRLLPPWLGWLGIAAVAVSGASALTMVGPTDNRSVIYGILLAAAVIGFAWLVAASLVLTRRHPPVERG